ncbi:hypothetical protein BMS3Abin04_02543 [bacterium BMS3Abin04]|nr:hypothetical protein BMS3Abin04_02543 [bacterium BMS3Abin04]
MRDIKKYTWFILIISIFLLSSCEVLENNNYTINPLDSKIDFRIIESYPNYEKPSQPQIYLQLKTEKKYPCMNYEIITNYQIKNRIITLEIPGIEEPNICLTAFGPAAGSIKLGNLSGIYELKINNNNNFSDSYNLLINDSLIILDGKETADTKPLINFYWRHPKNSFAYTCNIFQADSSLCKKFIDTLKTVINITEFKFPDYAVVPYAALGPGNSYDINARYFYYESENEFDKIEEVMKVFKQNYFPNDEGVSLTVINWLNKKIESRLL